MESIIDQDIGELEKKHLRTPSEEILWVKKQAEIKKAKSHKRF